MMLITHKPLGPDPDIIALFSATFTASEGADEGAAIGGLVQNLSTRTPPADGHVYLGHADQKLIAAVIFTRLTFGGDARLVYLLSPMAVATQWQGKGMGQALLRHALDDLRGKGGDVAVTYGDPDFYGKVGFMPTSIQIVPAPFALSQPIGWIANSLRGGEIAPLPAPVTCAAALNDPAYW
jgi:putative acetyltransferase